jgi:1-acyl-sn-glycerol-3-phosphate acyltransferase
MNGFLKHPFRVMGRLFWLGGEILLAMLDFVINVLCARKVPLVRSRAVWLQQTCRRMLRVLNTEVATQGPIPLKGLLVSNHLGYLDILVLSAITPVVFIGKSHVKRWPVFGWFAILSGTLFVRHNRRSDVARLNQEVARILEAGGLVVLFPERSGSDERLPFKSSLLEPVTRFDHPLAAASIRYSARDEDSGEEACYKEDTTFAPHLLHVLAKLKIKATVSFTRLEGTRRNRKELALRLRSQVVQQKEPAISTVVE